MGVVEGRRPPKETKDPRKKQNAPPTPPPPSRLPSQYAIHKLRSLTRLDWTKVGPGERASADAACAAGGAPATTFEPGAGLLAAASGGATTAPTAARLAAVAAAIAGAATLEEVARLEASLAAGDMEEG